MKSVVPAAIGILWAVMACAAPDQVGLWRTIDDETGKERSLIRITEINGELQGVVEKIFERPGDDPAHLCKKCEGDRKGKPVIGMTIMWGLKKKNDIDIVRVPFRSGNEVVNAIMSGTTPECSKASISAAISSANESGSSS